MCGCRKVPFRLGTHNVLEIQTFVVALFERKKRVPQERRSQLHHQVASTDACNSKERYQRCKNDDVKNPCSRPRCTLLQPLRYPVGRSLACRRAFHFLAPLLRTEASLEDATVRRRWEVLRVDFSAPVAVSGSSRPAPVGDSCKLRCLFSGGGRWSVYSSGGRAAALWYSLLAVPRAGL